jgi:xanthine dehydrogenase YagT iron-sulfur-binding subunit
MPTDEKGLSRRGFLRSVGATTVAGGLATTLTPAQEAAAQAPEAVGPGEVPVTLNINGKDIQLNAEPRVTLLDALRNRLDLTGAKKVCDRGTCGACTVLMDDEPVYACSILAIDAQGRRITTIEGLGTPDSLNAVQSAFVENDAQQCGFCTPGFVVSVTAFLKQYPDPSVDDIRRELGGNLCRCGTYAGITQAVLDAAKTMKGGA